MSVGDILKSNQRVLQKGPSTDLFEAEEMELTVQSLENHEQVCETIQARLRLADLAKQAREEEMRRALMAWMQQLDTDKEDSWESKRYMPLILQQIETAAPILYSAVFDGPHIWQFHGLNPKGRGCAEALDKLCHWQANNTSGVRQSVDRMNFFSLLFGTGILDTQWSSLQEVQWVPKVVEETDDEGNLTGVKTKVLAQEEVTVEDWPVTRCINPMNVWLAPHGEVGDKMPWFIERIETTIGELMDAAGGGHIDKEAVEHFLEQWEGAESQQEQVADLFESATVGLWDDWLSQSGHSDYAYTNDPQDEHDRDQVIYLLEYRSRTERITIAPGKIIVGASENPYIHQKTGIIVHHFIPVPESPWGRGLATVLLGHQELVNENINLYMDTARISLMAPIIVNRSSMNPLDKNTMWTPNKMLYARDVNNAARRMDVPAPDGIAFNLDNHLKADAELTTGFSKQSAGVASTAVGTATEAQALQTNLATRTRMHVVRLRETIKLLGEHMVSLNQQFMTEDQVVSVVGEDGLEYFNVEPWEVVGKVMVQSVASPARANPALRSQQLISALQVFLPILQQGGMTPVIGRLLRALLKAIEVEDVDLIIPKSALTVRAPHMENIALERLVPVKPSEFEDHAAHIMAHSERRAELEENGADERILAAFDRHIEETAAMAQQAAGQQGPDQQAPQQDGLGGDRPGGQQATGLGQAAGNQGVAGQASPGPGGAPGRPQ